MAKGIYVELAHHPQAILDTLDRTEQEVQRAQTQRRLGCGLAVALIGLGALALLLGVGLGFGLWLAVLGLILIGMAVLTGVALLVSRSRFPREQFDPVRRLLHTLRDDTGRRGWVAGWLDMTGPRHKTKQVRTARSGGGKEKVYYHDPWFQAKIKLVDGNVLRLSLVDKVKTKAGGVVGHRTQLSAKLVVNPAVYRLGALPSQGLPLPAALDVSNDGTLSLKAELNPRALPVDQILGSLKTLYTSLEPIQPTAPAPPSTN